MCMLVWKKRTNSIGMYNVLLAGWPGIRTSHGIEQRVKKNGFYKRVLETIETKAKQNLLNFRYSIHKNRRFDVFYSLSGVGLTLCHSMQQTLHLGISVFCFSYIIFSWHFYDVTVKVIALYMSSCHSHV